MMKTNILLVIMVLTLAGCTYKTADTNRPKGSEIEVTWRNIETMYKGKEQFLSEFEFKNKSKFDLKNKGWAFYFNTIRTILPESNELVQFEHVNGDLYRMLPTEKFLLSASQTIKITFVSEAWVISKTDAPAGGFFVFDGSIAENCPEIKVGNFDSEKQTQRKANDIMPVVTPEVRYKRLAEYGITNLPESELLPLIPKPVSFKYTNGNFILDKNTVIVAEKEFLSEAHFLSQKLKDELNILCLVSEKQTTNENVILIGKSTESFENQETYKLSISQKSIKILAQTPQGAFNGISSLRALISANFYIEKKGKVELKALEILDYPQFEYRGMHLDIARNFQPKESVLKLLDAMAFYKLNKLHLHFCDDEGWRIEINGLPELTAIGSKRAFSLDEKQALLPSFGSGAFAGENSGSGFYTRAEFVEILRFAAERHIEIIPEIDFPGHARAAIVSMRNRYENLLAQGKKQEAEKYLLHDLNDQSAYKSVQGWKDNVVCVAQESVYTFLEHIVSEFAKMYKEADVEFKTVHTGGDEVPKGVWEKSPVCNNFLKNNTNYTKTSDLSKYFITRYNQILQKYNLKTAGWEEIALEKTENGFKPISEFASKGFVPYVWNNVWNGGMEDIAYQLANKDFPVVLCNVTNLYFDLAYEKNPEEPGYYWGAFIDTRAAYEFTPYDVRNCSYTDLFGNKIDPYKMFEGKELLQTDKQKNIIGIQGQLWSENTKSPQMFDYMLFPKLLALAERAWTQPTEWSKIGNTEKRLTLLNKDWNIFANTLGNTELKRLDVLFGSINYRIAPPAAKLENGLLSALSEFPGLEIRYTLDGSEPNSKSALYTFPIKVDSKIVKLKCFSQNARESRCEELNEKSEN